MASVSRRSKTLAGLAFVLLLTFFAAGTGVGFMPALLGLAFAATVAILSAFIAVSLTREGH
ncbi:hypothetical protein ATER59S_02401 [Aquamicrobium terrae]